MKRKPLTTPFVLPTMKPPGTPAVTKPSQGSKPSGTATPKSKSPVPMEPKKDGTPKQASSNIARREGAIGTAPDTKTAESPVKPQSSSQAPPKMIPVNNTVKVSAPTKVDPNKSPIKLVETPKKEKDAVLILEEVKTQVPTIQLSAESEERVLPPPQRWEPAEEERLPPPIVFQEPVVALPPPQRLESPVPARPIAPKIVEEAVMVLRPPQPYEEEEPAPRMIPMIAPCIQSEERDDPPMLPPPQPYCEEPSIQMAIPPAAWEEDETMVRQPLKPFVPMFDADGDEDIKDSSEEGGVTLLQSPKSSTLQQTQSPNPKSKKKGSRPRKPRAGKLAKGDVVIKLDESIQQVRSPASYNFQEASVKALPPREEAAEEFRDDNSWSSHSDESGNQIVPRVEEYAPKSRKPIFHEDPQPKKKIVVPVTYNSPVARGETYSPEPQIKQRPAPRELPIIQPHQFKSRMIEEELEETVDNSRAQVNFDVPRLSQNPRERFRTALEQPGTLKLAFEVERDRQNNPLRVMLEHEDVDAPKTSILGIPIDFDGEPEDAQIRMAEDVITCLSTRRTALCETGLRPGEISTVLNAALGWLSYEREQKLNHTRSKIIVLYDRNPDRIISAIQRLKIKPRVTVLGTRDTMCTNAELEDFDEQTKQCKCLTLVQGQVCSDFNVLKRKYTYLTTEIRAKGLFSTEDIGNLAASHGACPYFLADTVAGESQLLIASIEHLAMPHLQSALAPHLANSILIVEEAGRILELGEGLSTLRLTSRDVPELSDEFLSLVKHLKSLEEFSPQAKELGMKAQDLGGAILELHSVLQQSQEYSSAKRLNYKELKDLMIDLFLKHRPDFNTLDKLGDLEKPLKQAAQAIPNTFFEILAHIAEKPLFLEFAVLYRYAELLHCLSAIYLSHEDQKHPQEFYAVTLGGPDQALSLTPLSAHLCLGTLKSNPPWSTIFCSRTTSSAVHLSTEFQLHIDSIISAESVTSGPVALALTSACGAPLAIDANSTVSRSVANELGHLVTSALAAVGGRTLIYLPSAHVLRHVWGSWKEIVPSLESTEVLAETDVVSEDDSTIRHFCSDEPRNIALLLCIGGRLDKQILTCPPVVAQVFFVGLPLAGARSKSQRLKHLLLSRLASAGQSEDFLGYRAVGDIARRLTPHPAVAPSFASYLFLDCRVAPGSPWETYLPAWVRPKRVENAEQALTEWRRLTSPLPGMLISLQHADITMITETAHTSREMWLLKRGGERQAEPEFSEEAMVAQEESYIPKAVKPSQRSAPPAQSTIVTETPHHDPPQPNQPLIPCGPSQIVAEPDRPLEIVRIYNLEAVKFTETTYVSRIRKYKPPSPLYPWPYCRLETLKLLRTKRNKPILPYLACGLFETADYYRDGGLWRSAAEPLPEFEPSIRVELARIDKLRMQQSAKLAQAQAEARSRLEREHARLKAEEEAELAKLREQEELLEQMKAAQKVKLESEKERIRALKAREEKAQEELRLRAEAELEKERQTLKQIENQKLEIRSKADREREKLRLQQLEKERIENEAYAETLRAEQLQEKNRLEELELERKRLAEARQRSKLELLEKEKLRIEQANERARLQQLEAEKARLEALKEQTKVDTNRFSEVEEITDQNKAPGTLLRPEQEAKLEALANLARISKAPQQIPRSPQKFIKQEYIEEEDENNFDVYVAPVAKNSLTKRNYVLSPQKEQKPIIEPVMAVRPSNLIQKQRKEINQGNDQLQLGKRNDATNHVLADSPMLEKKHAQKLQKEDPNAAKRDIYSPPAHRKQPDQLINPAPKKLIQGAQDQKIDARNLMKRLEDKTQIRNPGATQRVESRGPDVQQKEKSPNMHALIKSNNNPQREPASKSPVQRAPHPQPQTSQSKVLNIENFLNQQMRNSNNAAAAQIQGGRGPSHVDRERNMLPAQPPTSPVPKTGNLGVAKLNDLIKMVNSTQGAGSPPTGSDKGRTQVADGQNESTDSGSEEGSREIEEGKR